VQSGDAEAVERLEQSQAPNTKPTMTLIWRLWALSHADTRSRFAVDDSGAASA